MAPPGMAVGGDLTPRQLFDQMIAPPGFRETPPTQEERRTARLRSTYILGDDHQPLIHSNFEVKRAWIEPIDTHISKRSQLKLRIKEGWTKARRTVKGHWEEYQMVVNSIYGDGTHQFSDEPPLGRRGR